MNCMEFRRRIGAEPAAGDADVLAHAAGCSTCAAFRAEMRAMDEVLGRAMRIDLSSARPARVAGPAPAPAVPAPSRWLAIAASLVLAVLVASTLWVSFPEPTLATEVLGHVEHEPASWQADQVIDAQTIDEVLSPSGLRLRPGAPPVTYALRCKFAGRWVPHLVVQTEQGPVTVLLLTHRHVESPQRLDEQGYAGEILPAPRGSIAVVARRGSVTDLDGAAARVMNALEWDT